MLDRKITIYNNVADKTGRVGTLAEFLFADHREQVQRIRSESNEERKKQLKRQLPCATISGVFRGGHKAENLIEHSGLICIDIDGGDNPGISDWEAVKNSLSFVPCVLWASLSASGHGVYCIIPLAHPALHHEQFKALQEDFKINNVTIDEKCSDLCRLRFASYDSNPYCNPFAVEYTKVWRKPVTAMPIRRTPPHYDGEDTTIKKVAQFCQEIQAMGIDLTANYDDWYKLGFALASLGEQGRPFYHAVSQFYDGYCERETDKKFTELLRSHTGAIGIGTFFEVCKRHGIVPITTPHSPSTARPTTANVTSSPVHPSPPTPPTPPPTAHRQRAKEQLTDDDIYMLCSDRSWPFTTEDLQAVWT